MGNSSEWSFLTAERLPIILIDGHTRNRLLNTGPLTRDPMPNLASLLKFEVLRLARKEVPNESERLKKAFSEAYAASHRLRSMPSAPHLR